MKKTVMRYAVVPLVWITAMVVLVLLGIWEGLRESWEPLDVWRCAVDWAREEGTFEEHPEESRNVEGGKQ